MSETPETPKRKRNRHYKKQNHEEQDQEHFNQLSSNPQVCLAIYIAMAHAGLALSLALLYSLTKLLQEYWRPIQWAILCSMPLRELQTALVRFWSHPLKLGLPETLIAIPVAVLRSTTGSLIDSHVAVLRLLRNRPPVLRDEKIGFSKLMQWLVSFALFVLVYEKIGAFAVPAFAIPCLIGYATGCSTPATPGIAKTLSAISSVRRGGQFVRKRSIWSRISKCMTLGMLNRLKTTVGIGLIIFMIVGSVSGFVFFSYKIGIEGKDAVFSLKTHLEESNYAERIGIKQWMDENQVPELIDTYTMKLYETVSMQIDSLALQYNVTDIVEGFRNYLIKSPQSSFTSSVQEQLRQQQPWSEKLYYIQSKVRKREWNVIYRDIDGVFREFMSVIAREDLVEKIKEFVLQSLDVSKRVFASSTMVLAGGANLLFSVAVSIVSGAAGLLNFISQMMLFFWLLYYLITSESGGVMDHVLGMLPLSKTTRVRCADVLDHAVSSVLLAAAKVTFFQGCLTYLLFRFYHIHFLYMSTFLALMSAVLPITPAWLSTIPAAAQLVMEVRYAEAVLLTVIHLVLLDYGTAAIQDEIPGQSAYLTGLSILGGIALFPSVLEGAIMGPLLMTVMIALKNLYVEFVLVSAKETSR
ncbi:hypothetical protein HHK36_029569 [Tetracentron sinense]|uniref:Transmembrane protein 245 n=1 Tax=Tetracentron sinense TaxID=13715 RepID=A0A834YD76_TETSI|nr:hypothetical protein HHK36_029569 [Tetracentron sinense]